MLTTPAETAQQERQQIVKEKSQEIKILKHKSLPQTQKAKNKINIKSCFKPVLRIRTTFVRIGHRGPDPAPDH